MCVLTVFIFAVVLVVSSFYGEKKSISASAEEVTYPGSQIFPTENLWNSAVFADVHFSDRTLEYNGTLYGESVIAVGGGLAYNTGIKLKEVCPRLVPGTYTFSATFEASSPYISSGNIYLLETNTYMLHGSGISAGKHFISTTIEITAEDLEASVEFFGSGPPNGPAQWDNIVCNVGSTAYPYCPPVDAIYDDAYNKGHEDGYNEGESAGHEAGYQEGHEDGYNEGESAGHEAGYQEGYEEAVDKLSNVLITEGNGEYATARNKVVGYVGGTDYLQFDTASGSADLTGLPSDPYVSLRLQVSIDASSQYVISYDSLAGYCSLGFFIDDVMFNLFTLPETTKPVTINFTLPYGLNGGTYVVDELFLLGYKEPLDFDFDENHYKTGGPCVLKGMKLYCRFDGEGAYNAGYEVGYNEGSEVSEQEKQEKYEEGKQAGYNQGISEKTNAFSYINAIITAPVDAVLSMFDVDFMGWNLKGLLGLLVCGAIIAIVIKVLL